MLQSLALDLCELKKQLWKKNGCRAFPGRTVETIRIVSNKIQIGFQCSDTSFLIVQENKSVVLLYSKSRFSKKQAATCQSQFLCLFFKNSVFSQSKNSPEIVEPFCCRNKFVFDNIKTEQRFFSAKEFAPLVWLFDEFICATLYFLSLNESSFYSIDILFKVIQVSGIPIFVADTQHWPFDRSVCNASVADPFPCLSNISSEQIQKTT